MCCSTARCRKVAVEDLLAKPTLAEDGATYAALLREYGITDSETILRTESPLALSKACNLAVGFAVQLWEDAAAAEG